jgi:hypothetical protein
LTPAPVAHAALTVDHAVLGWLLARRRWWLTRLAIMVTDLGSPAVLAALTAAGAAAVWWQTRSPRNAIVLLAGTAVLLGSAFLAPRYFTHAGPDGSMMKSAQPR